MTTRPRDAQGRRIPRPGTRSRRIYDLLVRGFGPREICDRVGGAYPTVGFLIWKIRHPEQANRLNGLGGPAVGRIDVGDRNPRMQRPNWRQNRA